MNPTDAPGPVDSGEPHPRARTAGTLRGALSRPGWHGLAAHALVGALAGMLVLHPVTKAIYGNEWHGMRAFASRVTLAFSPRMLPMGAAFALLGGMLGLVFGGYHRLLATQRRALGFLEAELGRTVPTLITSGESEHLEFKASARWSIERGSVSRDVEAAIARTIAGFLNHTGGSLLIGVTDEGVVCGLHQDYSTLHDPNRDGFERFIISLVRTRLGGEACTLVHVAFHQSGDRDVCRAIVEPSSRPVYFHDGSTSRYFVRTGNSTRELDVREAMEHIARRFGGGDARRSSASIEPARPATPA